MSIDLSGNVGIGTATPSAKLDVLGGFAMFDGLRVSGADTNTIWQSSAAPLNIAANGGDVGIGQTGTPQLIIKPSGEVGINTTSPAAKLDVNGPVKIGSAGSPIQHIKLTSNATCGAYSPAAPIPANNGASCTISTGGVNVGDIVMCAPTSNPGYPIINSCYVSAASQITVGVQNLGASGLASPPTNWNVTVIKF